MFHTNAFILGFLPVCVVGFFALGRLYGATSALRWLIASNLFFYAWWNPAHCLCWLPQSWETMRLRCGCGTQTRHAPGWSAESSPISPCWAGSNTPISCCTSQSQPRPAAGDQLLYFSADHVPGRHGPRGRRGVAPLYPLCRLRHLLSSSHSRSYRAARQHHPAAYRARDDPPAQ
jgi:hypothetical protein